MRFGDDLVDFLSGQGFFFLYRSSALFFREFCYLYLGFDVLRIDAFLFARYAICIFERNAGFNLDCCNGTRQTFLYCLICKEMMLSTF